MSTQQSTTNASLGQFGDNGSDEGDGLSMRQRIIAAVGNSGEVENTDTTGCVVGDDDVVLWSPDDHDSPLAVHEDEYGPAGDPEWDIGYTDFEDGRTVALFTLSDGESRARVDAEKVDAVARELDMDPSDLLAKARLHERKDYPVQFEVETGELILSPIMKSESEIRNTHTPE